jgi:hypothetical protein
MNHPGAISDSAFDASLATLVNAVDTAITETRGGGDEVLYGRAGLLWAMLNIRKCIREHMGQEGRRHQLHAVVNSESIEKVVNRIIETGKATADAITTGTADEEAPLCWHWHDKIYLGGFVPQNYHELATY